MTSEPLGHDGHARLVPLSADRPGVISHRARGVGARQNTELIKHHPPDDQDGPALPALAANPILVAHHPPTRR